MIGFNFNVKTNKSSNYWTLLTTDPVVMISNDDGDYFYITKLENGIALQIKQIEFNYVLRATKISNTTHIFKYICLRSEMIFISAQLCDQFQGATVVTWRVLFGFVDKKRIYLFTLTQVISFPEAAYTIGSGPATPIAMAKQNYSQFIECEAADLTYIWLVFLLLLIIVGVLVFFVLNKCKVFIENINEN